MARRYWLLFAAAVWACAPQPAELELAGLPQAIHTTAALQIPTPIIRDAEGHTIQPEKPIRYSTSPAGVMIVEGDRLSAIANGTATLIAEIAGTPARAEHAFKVQLIDKVELTCVNEGCNHQVGEDIRMRAVAKSGGAVIESVEARWSSDDPATVEVLAGGKLRAKSPGRATLTVAFGPINASETIRVSAAPDKIDLPCPPLHLMKQNIDSICTVPHGENIHLSAKVFGADHPVYGARVKWSSSDPETLTVDADGKGFGVALGEAKAIAEVGAIKATLDIRVIDEICAKSTFTDVELRVGAHFVTYRCKAKKTHECIKTRMDDMPLQEVLEICCCTKLSER